MWILVSWILIYTVLQRGNIILKKLCTLCPYYVEHGKLHVHLLFVWFDYVLVNKFSVMSGQVFLGWTSTKQRIKCLAQGHNTVMARTSNPKITSLTLNQLSHCAFTCVSTLITVSIVD